jgi:phosphoribosylanthranilate isomerase
MALEIKVCGLVLPEDAREAAMLGADYLGAIFYEKSPRHVKFELIDELLAAMPKGKRVMVDVLPDDVVVEERRSRGFDYFQIHFDLAQTPVDRIAAYERIVGRSRLWLAPRLKPEDPLPDYIFKYAGRLVMDTYRAGKFGGTGEIGEWERFSKLKISHPETKLVLAGGLGPNNVADAIRKTGAEMIDLNSGIESAPGVKDHGRMAEAILAARRTSAK